MYGDFYLIKLPNDVSLVPPIHQISVTIAPNARKRVLLSSYFTTLLIPFPC
jgi:hypothetical protein